MNLDTILTWRFIIRIHISIYVFFFWENEEQQTIELFLAAIIKDLASRDIHCRSSVI